jgi:hypothetical protein
VPGIVLQDEEPDQEEGGREVQGQGEEEGVVEGKVGQVEEAQKGEKRVRHLAEASPGVGFGLGFYLRGFRFYRVRAEKGIQVKR